MKRRTQVIIVGGGPTGTALAVDLGLRGIATALVESRTGMSRIPKGQNLTHRMLEHFHFWGLSEEIRDARVMPRGYPIGEITAYENLMSDFWQAPAGRELIGKYFSQANDRMPQYQLEGVLRERLTSLANSERWLGWSAKDIRQDQDGVSVTIGRDGSDETAVLEGDYVVGCDGGHSLVRERLGVERRGTDFDQIMVLAVFRSKQLHEGLKRFPERSTYRVMHPDLKGYWQFFGRIDVGEGWFFHAPVPPNTTRENFDFQKLIESSAGFAFDCEFEHVGFWDLRTAVAERYRVGRAFIAGDAAHSHPPYGGFGLNNGLEDAVNLGWKLAARLNGWGSDRLLDTYDQERRPVFADIAENFIAARIKADGDFLARYNPTQNRAEFEQAWATTESDIGDRFQAYETNYEGSAAVFGPPGGVCSAHGSHRFTARPGHHLAPQALSSGKNAFNELSRDFTLLSFGDDDATAFARGAKALGIPLKIIHDPNPDARRTYEASLILVRPDQFVAWAGTAAPADPTAILARAAQRH